MIQTNQPLRKKTNYS